MPDSGPAYDRAGKAFSPCAPLRITIESTLRESSIVMNKRRFVSEPAHCLLYFLTAESWQGVDSVIPHIRWDSGSATSRNPHTSL